MKTHGACVSFWGRDEHDGEESLIDISFFTHFEKAKVKIALSHLCQCEGVKTYSLNMPAEYTAWRCMKEKNLLNK